MNMSRENIVVNRTYDPFAEAFQVSRVRVKIAQSFMTGLGNPSNKSIKSRWDERTVLPSLAGLGKSNGLLFPVINDWAIFRETVAAWRFIWCRCTVLASVDGAAAKASDFTPPCGATADKIAGEPGEICAQTPQTAQRALYRFAGLMDNGG
jgi:hypothetical protein